MARFNKIKVEVVDFRNEKGQQAKRVLIAGVEEYLMERKQHDSRWHLYSLVKETALPDSKTLKIQIDRSAYSNDLIEKIELEMY